MRGPLPNGTRVTVGGVELVGIRTFVTGHEPPLQAYWSIEADSGLPSEPGEYEIVVATTGGVKIRGRFEYRLYDGYGQHFALIGKLERTMD
jgi:hypothetical protein